MTTNYNSTIVYEGTSLIDKKSPIVALASGFTEEPSNKKIGSNMIQLWVLHGSVSPPKAIASKQDRAICGSCPMRGKACYVITGFAPRSMYEAYHRGSYLPLSGRFLDIMRYEERGLRLTAYGDLVAMPTEPLLPLIEAAPFTLAYTHAWRYDSRHKGSAMASVETADAAIQAYELGWQTFRAKRKEDPLLPFEVLCPHQEDQRVKCRQCRLCDGKTTSVAVDAHGSKWRVDEFYSLYSAAIPQP